MLLKSLHTDCLLLSSEMKQFRRLKDQLFDFSQGIYDTSKIRFPILKHDKAYPCFRHGEDWVAAFWGILKGPGQPVAIRSRAALGFDRDLQLIDLQVSNPGFLLLLVDCVIGTFDN